MDREEFFRLKKVQGKKKRDAGKAEKQAIIEEEGLLKQLDAQQEPTLDLLSTKDEDVIF